MHPDWDIRIRKGAMKLFRIFFTGILISFLGTLPLGTLNVAAMQISVTDGVRPAIYFSLGCMLVEIIYVRLSLVAMDWVRKQKAIFRWLQWITLLIIVALAVSSFIAATSKHATGKCDFVQYPAPLLAGSGHECHQPRSNSFLVWMEYHFICQKCAKTENGLLQFLYRWHRHWHSYRECHIHIRGPAIG